MRAAAAAKTRKKSDAAGPAAATAPTDNGGNDEGNSEAGSNLDGGNDDNESVASGDNDSIGGGDLVSQVSDDDGSDGDSSIVPINSNQKITQLHRKILNALASSTALSPVHVDVRNESYWYRERSRLGPRKHNALVVKQNAKSAAWEAFVFKLKPRESDGEIVPTKTIVSRSKSKWLAYKSCEQGAKDRDCCPTDNKKLAAAVDIDRLLSTHFRITVVSDRFHRLNSVERIALVYDEILKKVGESAVLPLPPPSQQQLQQDSPGSEPSTGRKLTALETNNSQSQVLAGVAGGGPGSAAAAATAAATAAAALSPPKQGRLRDSSPVSSRQENRPLSRAGSVLSRQQQQQQLQPPPAHTYTLASCLPERNKIGSIFGPNMCNLEVFRHLQPDHPLTLIIEAKTPAQWKPSVYDPVPSELFHMSHMDMTSLQIPAIARPAAHRIRIKILAKSFTDEALLAASYGKAAKPSTPTPTPTPGASKAHGVQSSSSRPGSRRGSMTSTSRALLGGTEGIASSTAHSNEHTGGASHGHGDGHGHGHGQEHGHGHWQGQGHDEAHHAQTDLSFDIGQPPPATLSHVKFAGTGTGTGTGPNTGTDADKKKKKKTPAMPLADRLGVDPVLLPAAAGGMRLVPGMGLVQRKKPKLGGVYGHFFHELPPAVREMIMERVTHNKRRIQKESVLSPEEIARLKRKALRREMKDGEMDFTMDSDVFDAAVSAAHAAASGKDVHRDSFQPLTNLAKLRAKAATAAGPGYDMGTHTEHEMIEELYIAAQKLDRIAVRMQRLRRANLCRRAARLVWRTKYAALTIQRVARGRFGRLYFSLCKKLYPLAASRIQWAFRSVKVRRIFRRWRFLVFRMSRSVLPLMKRFINNTLHRMWARKQEDRNAVRIQSLIRMHLCRARYLRELGKEVFFDELVEDAVVLIQKAYRGLRGRRRHREWYELVLQERVDVPAALRIQRVYRGYRGRLAAEMARIRYAALLLLQKNIRAWVQRVWRARMRLEAKKYRCACLIQKRYRGRMDRELVQFRREKRYHERVYLPAVIKVQSFVRRRQAMASYAVLLRQTAASTRIQRRYRRYIQLCDALRVYLARLASARNRMATKMQALIRGFFARLEFRRNYTIYRGKVIFAARVIMRAWMNFKFGRRFQMLMDKHRQKIYRDRVDRALAARDELLLDLKEIDIDIVNTNELLQRRKTRIQDLEVFIREANLRIPFVEEQIKNLSEEDAEKGWEESFVNEWSTLKNQLIMVREEIRLLRFDVRKRQEEAVVLNLELEEAYIELDAIGVLSMEATEGLHRNELNIAEREVHNVWNRRIRLERCRWRIRNFRKNVLLRRLMKRYEQPQRDMEFAETISYEKRQRVIDRERLTAQMRLAVARTRGEGVGIQKKVQTYEQYAGPVQDTYAGVVDNTMELLKGWSLDERAHRLKDETSALTQGKRKSTKGQFAPIKEPKNAPPDAY